MESEAPKPSAPGFVILFHEETSNYCEVPESTVSAWETRGWSEVADAGVTTNMEEEVS